MRLDTQESLTALNRFFDDVWKATRVEMGAKGHDRIRLAFGIWASAPSEAAWDAMTETLRELVGDDADWMLRDLEPYVRR